LEVCANARMPMLDRQTDFPDDIIYDGPVLPLEENVQ
jgi:hypothetical protein